MEHEVLGVHLFGDWEAVELKFCLLQARQYSVSKLAISLSDFTLLVWLFLAAKSILAAGTSSLVVIIMAIATVAYALYMLWGGRTSLPADVGTSGPAASTPNRSISPSRR